MDGEKLKQQIGSNIAAYRKRAGLTQAGLAEKLNYSDKAVSKWERGESMPDVTTLVQLAEQFDITVNDLILDPDELPGNPGKLEKAMTQVSEKALKRKADKRIILHLSSILVWFVALLLYVLLSSFDIGQCWNWVFFFYAIPADCIVLLSLRSAWHDFRWNKLLISAGVAFILTWIIWKEETPAPVTVEVPAAEAAPAAPSFTAPTTSVIRCANGVVLQPVKGNVIAREAIPDDTFASGVLGDGVGIEPEDELVVAPFDGTISSVAESKHAIGIEANGMEMLIHVGVDTVNMQGDGFECLVNEGDEVKLGQPLIRFSREKIKAAGYSDTVAVLLTNSDDLEGVECGAK